MGKHLFKVGDKISSGTTRDTVQASFLLTLNKCLPSREKKCRVCSELN